MAEEVRDVMGDVIRASRELAPLGEAYVAPNTEPTRKRGHVQTLTPFTSERAREVNRQRWDRAENVVRRQLREQAGGSSWAAGVGELARVQYEQAMSKGRGSTAAASWLMRHGGLMREREQAQDGAGAGSTLSFTASGEAAARLAELVAGAVARKRDE